MTERGFSKAALDQLRAVMAGHVERGDLPGLVMLVSREAKVHVEAIGRLAFEGSPMTRDAIFRVTSMTKPVTAAAAMILVEEGKLKLDDPVDPWLPEIAKRKVLLSVDEAASALSMGRTFVYELLTRGEIVSIKIGRRRRIPVSAFQEFVTRQLFELEGNKCA